MPAGSIAYLFLLVTGLLLFFAGSAPWWRLAVVSALALAFFLAQATELLPLSLVAAFLVLAFLFTVAVSRWPGGFLRGVFILVLVVYFLVARQFWFIPDMAFFSSFTTVGMSYMIFRAVHGLVEAGDGLTVGFRDFGRYMRYQLLPFGLQAGPVHDYGDYAAYEKKIGGVFPRRKEMAESLVRLSVGFIKVIALAPLALSVFHDVVGLPDYYLGPAALLFVTYIYVNFSGYMDIVVSSARMFGLVLPENFDRPWLASSFIEFWTRWHITLSYFFRDYMFYPLMGMVSRISGSRRVLFWSSILVSMVVFFLLGLWHGTEPMFVWVACFFAVGVALNRVWEEVVGKPFVEGMGRVHAVLGRLAAHVVGSVAVFYFALSAVPVWPEMTNTEMLLTLRRMGTVQGVLGVAASIVVLVGLRLVTGLWDKMAAKVEAWPVWTREVLVGVNGALLVILFRLVSMAHSPQIYYQDL